MQNFQSPPAAAGHRDPGQLTTAARAAFATGEVRQDGRSRQ
jgi:hypothetical protein